MPEENSWSIIIIIYIIIIVIIISNNTTPHHTTLMVSGLYNTLILTKISAWLGAAAVGFESDSAPAGEKWEWCFE